jgi:hypothetical protein
MTYDPLAKGSFVQEFPESGQHLSPSMGRPIFGLMPPDVGAGRPPRSGRASCAAGCTGRSAWARRGRRFSTPVWEPTDLIALMPKPVARPRGARGGGDGVILRLNVWIWAVTMLRS